MNGRIGLLLCILVVQLLLIGGLLVGRGSGATAPERLLPFAAQTVTSLGIESGPVASEVAGDEAAAASAAGAVVLERAGDRWRLGDLPADDDKVAALLSKLSNLGEPWPVATTAAARARFAVSDASFKKRLVLTLDGGDTLELLLGTSPGFKRLHARRAGTDAVYSIALADFEVPVASDEWLDKSLLALAGTPTGGARVGVFKIAEDGDDWVVSEVEAGPQAAATPAVLSWFDRFRSLSVLGQLAPAAPDLSAVDRFELTTDAGSLSYSLYHDEAADQFSIERDDVPGRFEIAGYTAEQMRSTLDALLAEPSTSAGPAAPVAIDPGPGS